MSPSFHSPFYAYATWAQSVSDGYDSELEKSVFFIEKNEILRIFLNLFYIFWTVGDGKFLRLYEMTALTRSFRKSNFHDSPPLEILKKQLKSSFLHLKPPTKKCKKFSGVLNPPIPCKIHLYTIIIKNRIMIGFMFGVLCTSVLKKW